MKYYVDWNNLMYEWLREQEFELCCLLLFLIELHSLTAKEFKKKHRKKRYVMSKIEVKNVYKFFGDSPSQVLPMVQDGATKDEILEKTGHTVGLDNVSIKVEEGETFVCMGLSG